VSRRSNARI